jgi:hypothetical protein
MATKRPDGRVEPGQRISSAFSARAWNRAQDAADVVLGAKTGATAGESVAFAKGANLVLVRNDTGQPVPMFGVLGISGVVINPANGTLTGTDAASARAREFAKSPVLVGANPSASLAFAIAVEPISSGQVGRAAVSGAFPVKVELVNGTDRFAVAREGDVTQLRSASCGVVQLIWRETATGLNKWAFGAM